MDRKGGLEVGSRGLVGRMAGRGRLGGTAEQGARGPVVTDAGSRAVSKRFHSFCDISGLQKWGSAFPAWCYLFVCERSSSGRSRGLACVQKMVTTGRIPARRPWERSPGRGQDLDFLQPCYYYFNRCTLFFDHFLKAIE